MVEMQMRIDDVANILQTKTEAFELRVDCMVAGEGLRPERLTNAGSPVGFSTIWVGDRIVDAGIPEDQPMLRMFDDPNRGGDGDSTGGCKGNQLVLVWIQRTCIDNSQAQTSHDVSSLSILTCGSVLTWSAAWWRWAKFNRGIKPA